MDKLASQSVRCVFVEYSRTQQGYRCFIPSTKKYIVSADVTFFETQRFFDSVDSPSESIPLPSLVEFCDIDATDTATMEKDTSRPLQVYQRHQRSPPAITSSTSTDLPPTDLNMPTAIRKGTRATTVHPISNFVTYNRLYPAFHTFALFISSKSLPELPSGYLTTTVEGSYA